MAVTDDLSKWQRCRLQPSPNDEPADGQDIPTGLETVASDAAERYPTCAGRSINAKYAPSMLKISPSSFDTRVSDMAWAWEKWMPADDWLAVMLREQREKEVIAKPPEEEPQPPAQMTPSMARLSASEIDALRQEAKSRRAWMREQLDEAE